jgi:hypothetical protein
MILAFIKHEWGKHNWLKVGSNANAHLIFKILFENYVIIGKIAHH